MMKDIKWIKLYEVLNRYVDMFIRNAQDILQSTDTYASGNLAKSMGAKREITVKNDFISVSISLAGYYEYIEAGARGKKSSPAGAILPAHFPNVGSLKKWIIVKRIQPQVQNGVKPTLNQLAYLIGRKIEQEGIKPKPFIRQAQEMTYQSFKQDIERAVDEDIAVWVNDMLNAACTNLI